MFRDGQLVRQNRNYFCALTKLSHLRQKDIERPPILGTYAAFLSLTTKYAYFLRSSGAQQILTADHFRLQETVVAVQGSKRVPPIETIYESLINYLTARHSSALPERRALWNLSRWSL
jgi:hypothetical protein